GSTALSSSFSYDALGRLEGTLDPDSSTLHTKTYTPWTVIDETYFGSVSSGNRRERKESAADGLGRLISVGGYADASGLTNLYVVGASYDPANRLLSVRDPMAMNPALCNGLPNATQCQSQHHTTNLTWDTMGRRVQIDDPDSGLWNFHYDDAGL